MKVNQILSSIFIVLASAVLFDVAAINPIGFKRHAMTETPLEIDFYGWEMGDAFYYLGDWDNDWEDSFWPEAHGHVAMFLGIYGNGSHDVPIDPLLQREATSGQPPNASGYAGIIEHEGLYKEMKWRYKDSLRQISWGVASRV